ncbi:MAG: MmcQ/YjbR family DNA-binding protein [Alistipes sp.]|nr:MmcQ/YjbR family DNA-binding protein [Alistipes sp.]MDE6857399.1 MmcQ/YjbR family DNA-binding protein [Alistipes sp.]
MNIEEFRDYCLSLAGAEESMPWRDGRNEYDRGLLCLSVAGKWFAVVHVDEFEFCLLKCPPEHAERLREQYDGVRPGWHMNKRHWNSVLFDSDVADDAIRGMIRLAYDTVVGGLPRRLRESIAENG